MRVATVDAFQGNEREVMLMSPTHTGGKAAARFVDDPRRTNVALTRARATFILVGMAAPCAPARTWGPSCSTQKKQALWYRLVQP